VYLHKDKRDEQLISQLNQFSCQ